MAEGEDPTMINQIVNDIECEIEQAVD